MGFMEKGFQYTFDRACRHAWHANGLTSPGGRLLRPPLLLSPPPLVHDSLVLFEDEDDAGASDEEGAMGRWLDI